MRETLIVSGLILLAVALRSCRKVFPRKLGGLTFLGASFCLFFFVTGSLWGGGFGVVIWFFMPWLELLTRIRRLRLPIDNRLRPRVAPNPAFFPNAEEAASAMEEAGFEHTEDCGWEWGGMQQYFRLFWNPEERAVASVCLCEQSEVAFSFISVTSRGEQGQLWRTTNFPFSPTFVYPPDVRWNHVPCERNCFHQILRDHQEFLHRAKVDPDDLRIPDPEELIGEIEAEMRHCIDHNLKLGIIRPAGDGFFEYSPRGLFFLWKQYLKDMVRLC